MALPSGGNLSFSQIQAEFSEFGTANNLRAYLRGAGLVPNIPENAAVPTGGPLSVRDFLGARHTYLLTAAPDFYRNVASPSSGTLDFTVTASEPVSWAITSTYNDAYVSATWSIISGQNTATATVRATFTVLNGAPILSECGCILTAQNNAAGVILLRLIHQG